MEIKFGSSMSNGGNYTQAKATEVTEVTEVTGTNQPQIQLPKENIVIGTKQEGSSDHQELNSDEAHKVSSEMNKFMKMLNSNIRFVLHEKTNVRMVQMVDNKDNTVLKEFPSHELLDIKAKIREYVGVLLDKHV